MNPELTTMKMLECSFSFSCSHMYTHIYEIETIQKNCLYNHSKLGLQILSHLLYVSNHLLEPLPPHSFKVQPTSPLKLSESTERIPGSKCPVKGELSLFVFSHP